MKNLRKKLAPHKSPLEHRVHSYLDKHYPRSDSSFVCRSSWERSTVPLDRIAYQRRPGGADPNKVTKFTNKFAKGKKVKRVVVMDPGGSGKMVPVDGYHRMKGADRAGMTEIRAFVGTPRIGAGDWRSDVKRMQAVTTNATGLENRGG